MDSLEECKAHLDRITFDDFKKLMKGQPKKEMVCPPTPNTMKSLAAVPEDDKLHAVQGGLALDSLELHSGLLLDDIDNPRLLYGKGRSMSYEQKLAESWGDLSAEASGSFSIKPEPATNLAVVLPGSTKSLPDSSMTPLEANRALYRKHREMRLAVLEASKQFDKKRDDIQNRTLQTHAGLIMKRGVKPPIEVEDSHARALFETAAKRCGRSLRRTRNKTVSDVTGMLMRAAPER